MKRIIILSLAIILSAVSLSAQSGFGIKAGLNFNSMSDIEINNIKRDLVEQKTGFHVGILYKIDLPLGFAIQPELLYVQKAEKLDLNGVGIPYSGELKSHNLQLPVNVQWGLNLMLLRPYIMVSPYLNYVPSMDANSSLGTALKWDSSKLGYGIGLGAGIDIWKLQIAGKYNWDLGKASEFEWKGANTFKGGKNKGFELSLAFIF